MSPKKKTIINAIVECPSPASPASESTTQKTIEQMYQSMTQEEHILARPDTYIGDIKPCLEKMFIFDDALGKIVEKDIVYVPGLYKIFDEILVNASDEAQRKKCNIINVNINQQTGEITVRNNGKGIDVELHKEHNMYVPELIFGKLLTSTNYDDTEKRTTGGRNGYGAKLTNMFSVKFAIDVVDIERKRRYYQEFYNNKSSRSQPFIQENAQSKTGYVQISFIPDFQRFGIQNLSSDFIALLKKRVYDIAGVSDKVTVYYNDVKIECKDFKSYISLYHFDGMQEGTEDDDEDDDDDTTDDTENDLEYKLYHEKVNDRWEIGFMYAPDSGNKYISFVNGICTYHGGTHVTYIVKNVIAKLSESIQKKHKDITIKDNQIKDNIIIFIKSVIENPAFTSQTKETLKTQVKDFGSTCDIKESTFKRFAKSGILNQVITMIQLKEQAILKKTDGKKVGRVKGIAKLEDANKAGSKESHLCSLILTEGDSAKALAMAGRTVVGSEYVGIYPLKGKPLNVRQASVNQLLENDEITDIKKIIGLEHGATYNDISQLRYGRIIVMADADVDGLHIKGLLINFIHYFWPSLLKVASPNFVSSLTTPILKASKGSGKNKQTISFYSQADYDLWLSNKIPGNWTHKYYKGLGTSTKEEAKEYFTDMNNKLIQYYDDSILHMPANHVHHENGVKPKILEDRCAEAVTLVFDKKRADDRKHWLYHFDETLDLSNDVKIVGISDFLNKQMIHFSNDDVKRSVPSICDGLKPSQRKILFGCFKKNITTAEKEIKVSQLAGYIGEHTEYHHGEASMIGTIIGMAQDFMGSNNINLLYPSGQFGTRLKGGKDNAAPRYIMTYLNSLTRLIFRPEDDAILEYLEEDGTKIEPKYYMPIIPMILVNGTTGIGTGFSVKIPSFNPLIVINNIRAIIKDTEYLPMQPWYKDFAGKIIPNPNIPTEFIIYGNCIKIDNTHIRITELPVGKWTEDYKIFLDKLENKKQIKSHISNNTDVSVNIVIEFDEDKLTNMLNDGSIYKKLGLSVKKHTTNMHLFSPENQIHKYKTPFEIMEEFYEIRMQMYIKRKIHLINTLERELNILTHKIKFIKDVIAKPPRININNVKDSIICARLVELTYPMIDNDPKFGYLLDMNIRSLTEEKIIDLENKCKNKEEELHKCRETAEEDMWLNDLDELEKAYNIWLQESSDKLLEEISKNTNATVKKRKNA